MLVDLSHVSPATMSDSLNVPKLRHLSHSSASALTDFPRNVPDSILRRLKTNGGVVMVTFVRGSFREIAPTGTDPSARSFQNCRGVCRVTPAGTRAIAQWDTANPRRKATLGDVADHIEHVRRVAGHRSRWIGSDYDGTDNQLPVGLEDVSTFPVLLAELSRRGWSEEDLRKLAGEMHCG